MSWLNELVLNYRADRSLADLYGIILYSDAHANIKKVLRDEDYWRSFDTVSGRHLAVFSVRAPARHRADHGDFGFMVGIKAEPSENNSILSDLQLPPNPRLPAIVWLTHDAGDLLRCVVPLNDRTAPSAYASIKEALTTAAEVVETVANSTSDATASDATARKGANLRNPLGIFAALNFAIDNKRDVRRLKKAIKIWEFLKELQP